MDNYGDQFQQKSKYFRRDMGKNFPAFHNQPSLYKTYPEAQKISLPEASGFPDKNLGTILSERQSIRRFSNAPLSKNDLSRLLWACTGISRRWKGFAFRTAPSAGALYPVETYLVINRVKEIEPGVYHYALESNELEILKKGEFGREAASAALGQEMCAMAPVVFIWSAIFQRSRWKYRQRCYRYIYLDAGHIAENLAIAAVSLDMGTCQIAALFDDEVNAIIDVDGKEESAIYMSVAGYPA